MKKYLMSITLLISTLSATNWEKIDLEKDPFTGKNGIAFINNSEDKILDKNIKLIVKCGIKDYPEIIVDWNTFLDTKKVKVLERVISYNTELEENISKINADTEQKCEKLGYSCFELMGKDYPISKDFTSMFYPPLNELKSNHKLALKSKLYDIVNEKTLILRAAPYNSNPITATFNLSGLKELIMPYKGQCQLPDENEINEIQASILKNIQNEIKKYQKK